MIESVEQMNLPFRDTPIDGTCYFHYTLIPAPKEIKQDFGLNWIVQACKSSRRIMTLKAGKSRVRSSTNYLNF